MVNTKKLNGIRNEILADVFNYLSEKYGDTVIVGTNALALAVVGDDGEEGWVKGVFSIPTGTRDGEEYDGYAEADNFELEQRTKREKKEEAQRKKEAKMQKDAEKRAAREKAKEEKEKEGE